jgi:Phospholipase_D-nuclease N-terminal
MVRVFLLLFAIELVLVVLALISCISAEPGQVRSLPKWGWIALIVLFPLIGSIAYFLTGRPLKKGSATGRWRVGGGFPEPPRPPRPLAPDDDPEFLRKIDQQKKKRRDEDQLRRWEEDLKRRDDKDPRNKDKTSEDPSPGDG